jgi:hypothetical protein
LRTLCGRTALLVGLLLLGIPGTSAALTWQTPTQVGARAFNGIACTGGAFCVAVGDGGEAVVSSQPSSDPVTWRAADVDGANRILSVSCPSTSFCAATDNHSRILTTDQPAAGVTWSARAVDAGRWLPAISCPTPRLCVAIDRRGGVLTSTHPSGGAATWHRAQGKLRSLSAISCPSERFCAATGPRQSLLVSSRPSGGARAWHVVRIRATARFAANPQVLQGISCPSAGLCLITGQACCSASVLMSRRPASPTSWAIHDLDDLPHLGDITARIGCGSPTLCAAVASSQAPPDYFSTTDGGRHWRGPVEVDSSDGNFSAVTGVACAGAGVCVAVDRGGRVIVGR